MALTLHSQNLNERGNRVVGSMFWHGRAWFYSGQRRERLHVEWLFGKHARGAAVTVTFGYGENDGTCLHVCIPWVASLYLVLAISPKCRETQIGVAIHNQAIWFHPLTDQNESRADHPWYRKSYCWNFPWSLDWHSTEILKPLFGEDSKDWPVVWIESRPTRKRGESTFEIRQERERSVGEDYPYVYTRKNGDKQTVTATVHVERRTWLARWWPIIPQKKVSTSIDVKFSGEVGEGVDDWKGGCIGCGYDMIEGETPFMTLKRMQLERKFDR